MLRRIRRWWLRYRPGLNTQIPLQKRLEAALSGAARLELAVAYARTSGTGPLLRAALSRGSRAVIGLGFGLSDPPAIEQLASAGMDVRLVTDSARSTAEQFHPKLYLASRSRELVVLSGSANLTGGGLARNVEQYEELVLPDPSPEADRQRERFEALWDLGLSLDALRRSGDWDEYRQRAKDRRLLEAEDRRRLLRVHADTGRLLGQLARRDTRRNPGYLGITHPEWWNLQLRLRAQADRALFWRRNTNEFKALAAGGLFFHLVNDPTGREELRAIRGFSVYAGVFETDPAESLWRRYGELLGVDRLGQLYERLNVEPGRLLGVIHLEDLTELDRWVTLEELRANGVSFARNIVSGRGLDLDETATILELGGLGVRAAREVAAELPFGYNSRA